MIRRALLDRVGRRGLVAIVLLVVQHLAARGLAAWDAGAHLLGGTGAAIVAGLVLFLFFLLRLAAYFAVPVWLSMSLVALVLDARRAPSRAS